VPAEVLKAYNADTMSFGKDYIIPKPFDKRLISVVPKAVFDAAYLISKKFLECTKKPSTAYETHENIFFTQKGIK
jgi:malic enzyme